MKTAKYYIIGGEYDSYCYGTAYTLHGAKCIATKNVEYWDNWQGWHTPYIYAATDVEQVKNFFGVQYAPKAYAQPVAWHDGNRWIME